MSYGGYNQGGYGQRNPYDQRDDYGSGGGYGQQQGGYGGGGYGQGNSYNNDVEMQPMASQGAGYGQSTPRAGDPNRILNECRQIAQELEAIERGPASQLQSKHSGYFSSQDPQALQKIDAESNNVMTQFRELAARTRKLKQDPEAGLPRNVNQVNNTSTKVANAMREFQLVESGFRQRMQEQQVRQYKIVNPTATDEEIREATSNPNSQVFQQALMTGNRYGQAQTTLNSVRERSAAIQNIERTMEELAMLFEDMATLVEQQDVAVQQIEQKGEEVQENIVKGNAELDTGIKSARAARKKKWCLFWFFVIFILVIVAAVVIWYFVAGPGANKNNQPKKLKF